MDYEEELEEQNIAINKYQEKIQDKKYKISKLQYTLASLENEKQQLISFLENKIKECDEIIKKAESDFQELKVTLFASKNMKDLIKQCNFSKQLFQEVLDFVNKGGKE